MQNNPNILMKCRLHNNLGLGILTFQLSFSEPHVSTEEVGELW